MKIFAVHKNKEDEKNSKAFQRILDVYKKQGHNLKSDRDMIKPIAKDIEALRKARSKIVKAIRESDIVVADITNADAKVGFDIAQALSEKKVVIAFQDESEKNFISAIHGNKEKNMILATFNENNLEEVAKDAVEEAKRRMDSKFILIISPEIDRYLDWASQTKRMHKAQIVRNSIENTMKRDKDYKNFIGR
ncbi:MAG: hypothetical protein Kow0081_0820 [Candidatus Dojkabacteria bacterium]